MDTPTKTYRDVSTQTFPFFIPAREDGDRSTDTFVIEPKVESQSTRQPTVAQEDIDITELYDLESIQTSELIGDRKMWLPSHRPSAGATLAMFSQRRIVSLPEHFMTGTEMNGAKPLVGAIPNRRCVSMPHDRRFLQFDGLGVSNVKLPAYVPSGDDYEEEISELSLEVIPQRDSPPKPIPALHGPASLPYARCPSGADGMIIAAPSELPNLVWGLHENKATASFTEIKDGDDKIINAQQASNMSNSYPGQDDIGTPLPPAYESPLVENSPMLPYYDQAILAMYDQNHLIHSSTKNSYMRKTEHSAEQRNASIPEKPRIVSGNQSNSRETTKGETQSKFLDSKLPALTPMVHTNLPQTSSLNSYDWHTTPHQPYSRQHMSKGELLEISSSTQSDPSEQLSRMVIQDDAVARKNLPVHSFLTGDLLFNDEHSFGSNRNDDQSQSHRNVLPSMPISLQNLVPSICATRIPDSLEHFLTDQVFSMTPVTTQPSAAYPGLAFSVESEDISAQPNYPRSIPLQRLLRRRLSSVPEETVGETDVLLREPRRCISDSSNMSKRPISSATERRNERSNLALEEQKEGLRKAHRSKGRQQGASQNQTPNRRGPQLASNDTTSSKIPDTKRPPPKPRNAYKGKKTKPKATPA